jgi:glycerol-3-phosphate acyltransferase PlsY
MAFWAASAVGLAIAYLFGSIPTGYLAGKLLKGSDLREHGSRSTGATNLLQTVGKRPALATLIAIALVGGLEQPLPYRLLVIAGGLYVICAIAPIFGG